MRTRWISRTVMGRDALVLRSAVYRNSPVNRTSVTDEYQAPLAMRVLLDDMPSPSWLASGLSASRRRHLTFPRSEFVGRLTRRTVRRNFYDGCRVASLGFSSLRKCGLKRRL